MLISVSLCFVITNALMLQTHMKSNVSVKVGVAIT